MKPTRRHVTVSSIPLRRTSLIACAALCAIAGSASADQVWTGATDALWTSSGSWNVAPPSSGELAIFNSSSLSNLATTLGADRAVLGLRIADPTAAVSIAAGNVLTIGASGIDLSTATQNLTISSPLLLTAAQEWNIGAGRTLTLANTATSTGSTGTITKSGAGILQLNAPLATTGGAILAGGTTNANAGSFVNTFGGSVTFQGGAILANGQSAGNTVTLNSNMIVAAGQTGTINMGNRMAWGNNDATIETLTGAGTLSINSATTVTRDDISADMTAFTGTINFGGTGPIRLFINGGKVGAGFTNSTIDLAGSVGISPQTNSTPGNTVQVGKLTGSSTTANLNGGSAGTATYSIGGLGADSSFDGGITGNAALTKVGIGTLTLTNTTNLSYTGATTVNAGTLKINGIKSGTGATSVNLGGILTGTGAISGTTTVNSGGVLAPGDGGIGNLTFANLTLGAGSALAVQFGGGNDTATVSAGGTLTLSAGATIDVNGFDTNGTYTLIDTTGATVSGSAATALTAVNGNGAKAYLFSDTGTAIQLTISSSNPTNFWKTDGGGAWNAAANWTKNAIPNASAAVAKIGPGPSGLGGIFTDLAFTITLDGNRTVGTLALDDAFGTTISIDPGLVTPGTLLFDNGALASNLSNAAGNHIINANVTVDADDLALDVAGTSSLTLNGTLAGSGAALVKSGTGTLVLTGTNTFDGGVTLGGGAVSINSANSLGNFAGPVTFSGGSLRVGAPLSGIVRTYQISGANNALIDTNGNDFGYAGIITPLGGATGGLTKSGAGILSLSAAQAYTGTTTAGGGVLDLAAGSSVSGTAANVSAGAQLVVSGGTLTTSAVSAVSNGSASLLVSGGTVNFNGGLTATNNSNNAHLITLTGGVFNASALTLGRSNLVFGAEPVAASVTNGFHMSGGTGHITGTFTVGQNNSAVNSSASALLDGGSLTVDGTTSIGLNNGGRWSVLDINGATFTSTDTVGGVVVGNGFAGHSLLLVRNGTATVERIALQQVAASVATSRLRLNGGALYVGSGGIVSNNNGGTSVLDVQLGAGTLAAKAAWSSSVAMTLNSSTTIQAADALSAPFDIALSGAIGGSGGFVKTGAGTLTLSGSNTYTGITDVQAGTLVLDTATLANASTVNVASTGVLHLPHGQEDTVADFQIDGVSQGIGTYTAANSGGRITGTGSIKVAVGEPFTLWIDGFAVGGLNGKNDDPDHDGLTNLEEFALDGNPTSATASGKVRARVESVGADQALVITLPVRVGAIFAGTTSKIAIADDVEYTIAGSNDLAAYTQVVSEIATSAAGLPALSGTEWTYRSFRLNGAILGATPRGPKGFLRATVEDAP